MKRPRFVQVIPVYPPAMFTVVERALGQTYWDARIADAQVGDEPEFRYTPPKKGCPFTVQQLANAAAGQLTEARGLVTLQEVRDGIPTFTAVFAANGRQVFCLRSTDVQRAIPVDVDAGRRWLASRQVK